MMQNYGSTVKLLSDLEILNEVFTCAFVFLSSELLHTLIFHYASLLLVNTTLKREKRIKIKREREREKKREEKISTYTCCGIITN